MSEKKVKYDGHEVSVFKIRIDSIQEHAIGFELFSGDKVNDTYVNMIAKGGYGVNSRLILSPKQFSDFATRLIAYVYLGISTRLSDEQLKVLWSLRLNIFDVENQKISGSIFNRERNRLINLGLMKGGKDDK
jgi:hypothetical protein